MVKIFKEESSNEEKGKLISQICIHVILVALTAICLLPFFVNDFDFIYEGKRCFAERANFISEFSTLSGKLCKSVDCKPFSDVHFSTHYTCL